MEKFKENCVINTVVSLSLSVVMLVLMRAMPNMTNFVIPTIEGFVIALILTYVIPYEKLRDGLSKVFKKANPNLLLILLTVIINVTCITVILTFQSQPFTLETIKRWLTALPILYVTALISSILAVKLILKKA